MAEPARPLPTPSRNPHHVPDGSPAQDFPMPLRPLRDVDPARGPGAVASAEVFTSFGDFTFWVLLIHKVRWVGGFGRMASTDTESYLATAPDPVSPHAAFAVSHLNEDHADALLAMAQTVAGHTDATAARCLRADRYGLDLGVNTPHGDTPARVAFAEPLTGPDGLRAATVELAKRARALG